MASVWNVLFDGFLMKITFVEQLITCAEHGKPMESVKAVIEDIWWTMETVLKIQTNLYHQQQHCGIESRNPAGKLQLKVRKITLLFY